MDGRSPRDLSMLIRDLGDGRPGAFEKVSSAVYEQLKAMARYRLRRRFGDRMPGVSFQPTEVTHEVLMRLMKQSRSSYSNADQFWAIVNIQIKRVLIDYYRRRKPKQSLADDHAIDDCPDGSVDGEALAKAIDALRQLDPRKADVVVCRYFFEMTIAETAESLGISHATVERDMDFAKAWLADELGEGSR